MEPVLNQTTPPDSPCVAGIDPSLTSSGATVLGGQQRSATLGVERLTLLPLAERTFAVAELAALVVDWVTAVRDPDDRSRVLYRVYPALVLVEAPDVSNSFGGLVERVNLIHEITKGFLGFGVPVGHVPSAVLKGYATGKGGGKDAKTAVRNAAIETFPELGIDQTRPKTKQYDQADSAWLAAMAADVLGLDRRVPDTRSDDWLRRPSIQYPPSVRKGE